MADVTKLLDGIGKVMEVAPQVYDDGAKGTIKETGKLTERIPRAINAALSGIDIWIAKKEYNVASTKKILEEKLANIEPEKIVSPEPYVAVPAIQAIAYSMDSEDLRNMYANLLAKAMTVDLKNHVHPSFVDTIKQMSPVDAENLKLFNFTSLPIVNYNFVSIDKGTIPALTDIFIENKKRFDLREQAISINVLNRLGLICISYADSYTNKERYEPFYHTNEYKEICSRMSEKFKKVEIKQGIVEATPFGRRFIEVCLES